MLTISEIVEKARDMRSSDIHLVAGLPPKCRVDGYMTDIDPEILTPAVTEGYARELAGHKYEQMAEIGEIDITRSFPCGVRTRINIFRQQQSVSMVLRILSDRIPKIEELGLPWAVTTAPDYKNGIILITGETGSGKSTTIAAILDVINHTRQGHIVTLEEPIEYIYTPDKCVVNQREVGIDTRSFGDGLRAVLREDPDVILIGEMRDVNTIETALAAADTGHLVFATLHTISAAETVERIVNVFPEGKQKQIRLQLASTLRMVLSQQLVRKVRGGRVAACEVMVVNAAMRNLIREGKTHQIESFIAMGGEEGNLLMDVALKKLIADGLITQETALKHARNRDEFIKARI